MYLNNGCTPSVPRCAIALDPKEEPNYQLIALVSAQLLNPGTPWSVKPNTLRPCTASPLSYTVLIITAAPSRKVAAL